jgi:hypothetical protein
LPVLAPDVLRRFLVDWEDVVHYFLRSVEADAAADGTAETAALPKRLLGYAGVDAVARRMSLAPASGPVLPMRLFASTMSS